MVRERAGPERTSAHMRGINAFRSSGTVFPRLLRGAWAVPFLDRHGGRRKTASPPHSPPPRGGPGVAASNPAPGMGNCLSSQTADDLSLLNDSADGASLGPGAAPPPPYQVQRGEGAPAAEQPGGGGEREEQPRAH